MTSKGFVPEIVQGHLGLVGVEVVGTDASDGLDAHAVLSQCICVIGYRVGDVIHALDIGVTAVRW